MASKIDPNDLIGFKIGRLTVVDVSEKLNGTYIYRCSCECGKEFHARRSNIKRGNTKSCGCIARDILLKRNLKHGLSRLPEYNQWQSMKQRCDNVNSQDYKSYGGRGITYSEDWKDFDAFIKDMGNCPSPDHSIDRIDNEKGYSKDNCKWSNHHQQAVNRRPKVTDTVKYPGVYHCKSTGKFVARLSIKRKLVLNKSFRTEKEAIQARRKAEIEHLGEYLVEWGD